MTFLYALLFVLFSCTPEEVPTPVKPKITSVAYEPCCGLDTLVIHLGDEWVAVPNVFTPNGDGVNDLFYPIISHDSISISSFAVYDTTSTNPFESVYLMYGTQGIDYNYLDLLAWKGTKRINNVKYTHRGRFTYKFEALYKEHSVSVKGAACSIVCDEEAAIFQDKEGCFFMSQFDAAGNPNSSLPSGEEKTGCLGN